MTDQPSYKLEEKESYLACTGEMLGTHHIEVRLDAPFKFRYKNKNYKTQKLRIALEDLKRNCPSLAEYNGSIPREIELQCPQALIIDTIQRNLESKLTEVL